MKKYFYKIVLTGLLATTSQAALAQSTSENTERIEQLEAALEALIEQSTAQQAEIAKLRAENKRFRSGGDAQQEEAADVVLRIPPDAGANSAGALALSSDASRAAQVEAIAVIREQRRLAVDAAAAGVLNQAEPLPILADGGLGAPPRRAGTAVGITGNKDGGRVAISLTSSRFRSGFRNGPEDCLLQPGMRIAPDDTCNSPTNYRQNVTSVTLSAPVSSGGDTSFATLDGLASGLKTEFRHTMYFGRMPSSSKIYGDADVEDAQKKCKAANPDKPQNCTEFSALYSDRYMNDEQQEQVADTVFNEIVAGSYGLTFSGSIGYDEFSFFPDATFMAETAERISLSAGAGFIYFPSRGNSLLFEGNFQRTFDGADDATRCRTIPDPDDDFLTCASGAFEGPEREEKFILGTQYRQQINLSDGGILPNIAIAPRIEFDALSNDYSLDVPIYLVANKKGMVAGVRFGFEDEDDERDVKIGVFYGSAFDLTPF